MAVPGSSDARSPLPSTGAAWTGSGPLTLSEASDATSPGAGDAPGRVCLIEAGSPDYAAEIVPLLRRRLAIAVGLAAAALTTFLVIWLTIGDRQYLAARLVTHAALAAFNASAAVLLLSPVPLSLRSLRGIELAAFGTGVGFVGWTDFENLRDHGWAAAAAGLHGPVMIGFTSSLSWFCLIILYGIFIPNSCRRTMAVTGSMAVAGLTAAGLSSLTTEPAPAAAVVRTVLLLDGVWLCLGVAVSAFGAHRIATLSREAFEARQLGRYCLVQRLGEGAMGEVHLARHRFLRRPCAVKLIKPEIAGKPVQLARFEREVQTTARLTHPNTVEIFDFGRTVDGRFFYVMEYLPGLTLSRIVIDHGPLPPARAVHVLRQVCGALTEAHSIGLIHRDIKPGNIMLCERGRRFDVAKVLDFGLVRVPDMDGSTDPALTQDGAWVGTPQYISPEQARGEPVDGRSDLYSLGATAYCLLTGRPPFSRNSSLETLLAQIGEPPTPVRSLNSDVPADLEAVIMRCLAKQPEDRFADAAALDRALAECACAAEWTSDRAAEWWRQIDRAGADPSVPLSFAEAPAPAGVGQ